MIVFWQVVRSWLDEFVFRAAKNWPYLFRMVIMRAVVTRKLPSTSRSNYGWQKQILTSLASMGWQNTG